MKKKKTLEEFSKDVLKKHNGKYIVVDKQYKNNKTPIKIKHIVCGKEFLVRPDIFLNRYKEGCPICSKNIKKKTNNEFLDDVKHKYGDEYTVLGEYKNSITKIKIKHNICNSIYEVAPARFLYGDRCPICFGSRKKNIDEFKEEVEEYTNKKISVLSDEYINNKEKMLFKCNLCGKIFVSRANNILSGSGCPHCNRSKAETIIKNILEKNSIQYTSEKKYSDLKSNGKKLRYDFEIYFKDKSILLEFDGEQHFHPNGEKFTKEKVREIHKRDIIKNKYALKNKIPLMRIPFTEFKNLYTIINNLISSTTIPDEFKVVGPSGSKCSAELYKKYNTDDIV